MHIDPALTSPADTYKLLTNLVVPRPIAWVTTLGPTGIVNLAPFSFFNAVGSNPPFVAVALGRNAAGGLKDTETNIRGRNEFVVNLVTEDLFDAMNLSAADFPPDRSELDAAGLHPAPSQAIGTPRVAEARVSLECRLHSIQQLGTSALVIGQVVMFQVADELMGERMHINGFAPLGRLGSPSVYCRTTDRFDVPRVVYSEGDR